jgi:hypothetical protein
MAESNKLYDLTHLEERLRHSKPETEPLSPAFKQQLRASLLEQPPRPVGHRFKLAAMIAAAAALLLVIVAVTPAGQIIADALLRVGPFTMTDDPSAVERTITATPDTVYSVKTETVPVAEASEQAGFTVLYPRYLPDGYNSDDSPTVDLIYNSAGEVSTVNRMWLSQPDEQILYYTQSRYTPDPNRSPFEFGIGDAEATPVTVGDDEGIWLEDFNWGIEANNEPVPYNVLIWQSTQPNGETFLVWLGSEARLPLAEMRRIVGSLAPATDGPANVLNIPVGDDIILLGFELTGKELILYWRVNAAEPPTVVTFVHWRDESGMLAAQIDAPTPARPWATNRTITTRYEWPTLSPGRYMIFVGLYDPDTGQRLSVPKFPNDEIRLTEIEIK